MRAAPLALAALALAGCLTACESSQEENAKLEKVYKRQAAQAAQRRAIAQRGLAITHPSAVVKVLSTSVLHDSEGAAAVVTLRNTAAVSLRNVPVEVTVKNAAGATVYTNATPGLAPTLVSVPLLAAHATTIWVDDQVQASGTPASVSAKVGEGEHDREAPANDSVSGVHLAAGEVEGSLANHSRQTQHEVVLYVIARRAGAIVAAGSAVVAQAEAGASAHFQAFLVGNPGGAQLAVSVAGAA